MHAERVGHPSPVEERITMVLDKGVGIRAVEDMLEIQGRYFTHVKLGFGTMLLTPEAVLQEKLRLYRSTGICVYPGGTLWEYYVIRKQESEFQKLLDRLQMDTVEISEGSIRISREEKLEAIRRFARNFRVISEVGYKDERDIPSPELWAQYVQEELNAGAWKVICEAREGGTSGIFTKEGKPREDVITAIAGHCDLKQIIWEAPQKHQQVWLIRRFGPNVNLGNIPWGEAMAVEALRQGLRGDTLVQFAEGR